MAVCVRYTENLEIKERFLGFVDCSERAEATRIYGQLKHFLDVCGIYTLPIAAAVMSGHVKGV